MYENFTEKAKVVSCLKEGIFNRIFLVVQEGEQQIGVYYYHNTTSYDGYTSERDEITTLDGKKFDEYYSFKSEDSFGGKGFSHPVSKTIRNYVLKLF